MPVNYQNKPFGKGPVETVSNLTNVMQTNQQPLNPSRDEDESLAWSGQSDDTELIGSRIGRLNQEGVSSQSGASLSDDEEFDTEDDALIDEDLADDDDVDLPGTDDDTDDANRNPTNRPGGSVTHG